VKLRNNRWIKIKGFLSGLTGVRGRRTSYTLIAESIDQPSIDSVKKALTMYISSTAVTKFIYRLLNENYDANNTIVIEYIKPEYYRVRVYGSNPEKIYELASSMNIVREKGRSTSEHS